MSSLDNQAPQDRPSSSALRVATARAVHQLLDEPSVLADPFALPILEPSLRRRVIDDPFQFNDPAARSIRAAVVGRSRLAEDTFTEALAEGVSQLVILGAGLDTFTLRAAADHPGVLMVEVDQPATLAEKRQRLLDCGADLPGNCRWLELDMATDDLAAWLERAGCSLDQPTWFSCLGVTPYLSEESVWQTLTTVASLPAGSGIVFDYRVTSRLLDPIEQAMERVTAEMFAKMGEPWRAHFDPAELVAGLNDLGFAGVRDMTAQDLNRSYFARRRDGLQSAGGGFRYIVAEC